MGGTIPEVEVADDANRASIGRPHCEGNAVDRSHDAVEMGDMCSQDIPETLMAPLADEICIHLSKSREETIRIVNDL